MCTKTGLYELRTISSISETATQITTEFIEETTFRVISTQLGAGTVALKPMLSKFGVNMLFMFRVFIDASILVYVLTKTPFKREFKKWMKGVVKRQSNI